MADTLRETLSDAYDKLAAEPAPEPAPVVETPPEPAAAAPEPSSDAPEPAEPAGDRARDDKGRFAPKTTDKAAPAPTEAGPAAQAPGDGAPPSSAPSPAPVVPAEPKFKAPQSWKPAIREKWAALPPEVQEEIARREGEVPKALEQAAEARRFQQAVTETLRPYEMLARAAGQHPVQYAAGLMQTAAALQTGAPPQRAAIVANIIRNFGVDVNQLAAELDRDPGQAQPQQHHQPPMDPRALIREEFQRFAQENHERRATAEVEKFTSGAEFANDPTVRRRMAALITAEAEAGVELSLQDAYDQVVASHPEYRAVMEQRKAADAAKAQQASTQRVRAAASGIKSQPTAGAPAQPQGLRAVLEAKYDELASR